MKKLYKEHLSKVLSTLDSLLDELKYEQIVIYSGEVKSIYLDDNTYPFKVNSNFKYLAPILNYPYSLISYKNGEKPKLFLFQKEDYWDSQPKNIEGFWTEFFEISYFNNLDKLANSLDKNLSQSTFLGEETLRFENLGFKSLNDINVINYLHFARTFKSDYEVLCIQKANELAFKAHKKAKEMFFNNATELQIHLAYLEAINFKESEVPYSNIVAFDENGAILHYVDYDRKTTTSKSFLLDAGATYNGYCSDITRTFVKDGHDEFKALIKAIDDSTLNMISRIKVGLNYEQLQEQMHIDIAKILLDFKLMNISFDEIYEKEYTKIFSPAGIGHYLGLQVHDVGNFIENKIGTKIERSKKHPFLRLRKNIEAGNVFTIEPGIYFIEQLLRPYLNDKKFNWDKINSLKTYGGVRIEDNISVKNDDIVNLTRPFFIQLDKH